MKLVSKGRKERLGLSFQFRYRPSETILKQIESLDRIGYLLQLVVSLELKSEALGDR